MKNTLLLTLGLLGAVACTRREAPQVTPTPPIEVPSTPDKPNKPEPKPPTYTGYEGYTLLFDSGLARILTAQPEGVGTEPHLYLLDRSGKRAGEVLQDQLKDYDGKGEICEGTLSEAGRYLAFLCKYDFSSSRKHQSRLILLEKQTLHLISNRLFAQPGRGGDQWVRHSFTLADGSTYLTFDKRSYYLLPKEGTEMTKLALPVAYALGAYAYGSSGYFFLEEDEAAYRFEAGQTTPEKLQLFAGSSVRRVYPAGGPWLILRDQRDSYQLFYMLTGKVIQRFTLSLRPGRSMAYNEASRRLFFTGEELATSSSDARERSVFVAQLPKEGNSSSALHADLFYRLAGRTEGDNRIGMQLQLGLQPDSRQLLLSWLDQSRGGAELRPVTKVVSLPLDATPVAPSLQYTFAGASDIRTILTLSHTE